MTIESMLAEAPARTRSTSAPQRRDGGTDSYRGEFAAMVYDGRLSGDALAVKQAAVAAIRESGSTAVANGSAKGFLAALTPQDLTLLQQATGLADGINVAALSEEGAANLLLEQGSRVDLNNDGLVEVGVAKTVVFPPVNAPQSVKDAWEAATAGMSEKDRMSLAGHIALPLTLGATMPGHTGEGPQLSDMANADFGWSDLIERLLYTIEISRPQNSDDVSDMLEGGVLRFSEALKDRGLA